MSERTSLANRILGKRLFDMVIKCYKLLIMILSIFILVSLVIEFQYNHILTRLIGGRLAIYRLKSSTPKSIVINNIDLSIPENWFLESRNSNIYPEEYLSFSKQDLSSSLSVQTGMNKTIFDQFNASLEKMGYQTITTKTKINDNSLISIYYKKQDLVPYCVNIYIPSSNIILKYDGQTLSDITTFKIRFLKNDLHK